MSKILLLLFACLTTAFGFSPITNPNTITTQLKMSSTTEAVAEVKVGDTIPSIILKEGQADYGPPKDVDLAELIKGKKVAIFAVPGAFTPGCSKSHLPSFMDAQDELKAKGVELTICIATNDAFVMEAWGRTSGGADAGIIFLSDANAELTKAFGLLIDSDIFVRSKRYSLIVDDGVVSHYFSSAEQSSDTWAPNVLAKL